MQAVSSLLPFPSFSYHAAIPGGLCCTEQKTPVTVEKSDTYKKA